MERDEIKQHWQNWAQDYGQDLRATTKTSTLKALELDALTRTFDKILTSRDAVGSVLEVGCGNGSNCLVLHRIYRHLSFHGVDFVEDMIVNARARMENEETDESRLQFQTGDILHLELQTAPFDIVFTDRCIINLPTDELQEQAVASLASQVRPGGHLVLIENPMSTYSRQNQAREILGLTSRIPAEFNHFLNEDRILKYAATQCGLVHLATEDFISLHDLMLYVLVPAVNGGVIDYEHPIVKAATELNIGFSAREESSFGRFGQNRLYCFRKG